MNVIFVLLVGCYALSSASKLEKLIELTDEFFEVPRNPEEADNFISYLERSYDLKRTEHRVKRQLHLSYSLRDIGIPVISNLEEVAYVPSVKPLDLTLFSHDGLLYGLALQSEPSSMLYLYIIQNDAGTVELSDSLLLDGGTRFEVQNIPASKETLVVVIENNGSPAQAGSMVYTVVDGKFVEIQAMSTTLPTDVALLTYFDEIFLALTTPSHVEIYRWRGQHFDHLQNVNAKNVSSTKFYSIENYLYLAAVSFDAISDQCSVWKQNLNSKFFECTQKLDAKPAIDLKFFEFRGPSTSEHFMAVLHLERAILYKHDGDLFQPFQNFFLRRPVQWLPVEGTSSEFALLLATEDGISGYAYNGWRFNDLELMFSRGSLGPGIKSFRTYRHGKDIWLVIANDYAPVGSINLFRLEFSVRKNAGESLANLERWCLSQLDVGDDPLNKLTQRFEDIATKQGVVMIDGALTLNQANITQFNVNEFGILNSQMVDDTNKVAVKLENVKSLLSDIDTLLETFTSNSKVIVGPLNMRKLDLTCKEDATCQFYDLSAEKLNKENMKHFLSHTVRPSEGFASGTLHFEDVRARNFSTKYINSYPAETLWHLNKKADIKGNLYVNGSVSFKKKLFVQGQIGGIYLDREHTVLKNGDQTLSGDLLFNSGNVENLQVLGSINGVDIANVKTVLPGNIFDGVQEQLNVQNLNILGELSGYNMSEIMKLLQLNGNVTNLEVDKINVASGIISNVSISQLVRTKNGNFNLLSELTFMKPVNVDDFEITNTINSIPLHIFTSLYDSKNSSLAERERGSYRVRKEKVPILDRDEAEKPIERSVFDANMGKKENIELHCRDTSQNYSSTARSGSVKKLIVRHDDNYYDTMEIYGPINFTSFSAMNLSVLGSIANTNWTEFTTDAVLRGGKSKIIGEKIINGELQVTDLILDLVNGKPVGQFLEDLEQPLNLTINGDVSLNCSLNADSVVVHGSIVPRHIASWMDETLVNDVQPMNNVIFEAGVHANFINNMNITRFISDAARIDCENNLKNVTFMDEVWIENLNTSGRLNGQNFRENVLLKTSDTPQKINDPWLIRGNLTINGDVRLNTLVNGLNLTVLCDMMEKPLNVIIKGSLSSSSEPAVRESLNNYHLPDLCSKLWFADQSTTLLGSVMLPETQMRRHVNLTGALNDVDLKQLPRSYLSKSMHRFMRAPVYVTNLTLESAVVNNITGIVNGLNMSEFANSILLDGPTQRFSVRPSFHDVTMPSIVGNNTINYFNLSEDLLLYNKSGLVVSGQKYIFDVIANKLICEKGVRVQGVDIVEWWHNAVLLNRSTTIRGSTTFKKLIVEGQLSVTGKVGPTKIDTNHVLTANGGQHIRAEKVINSTLHATSLNIGGLTNGVDLHDILENAGYLDRDLVIKGSIALSNLETDRIFVDGMVSGVNVSEFCDATENPVMVRSMEDEYGNLLNVAEKIHRNYIGRAYYLNYLKSVQAFGPNVTAVAGLPGSLKYDVAVFQKLPTGSKITSLRWDPLDKRFEIERDESTNNLNGDFKYVTFGRETENSTYLLVEFSNITKLILEDKTYDLAVRNITCATTLTLSERKKCVYVGQNGLLDAVFCNKDGGSILQPSYNFSMTNCSKVSSINDGRKLWLAVVGKLVGQHDFSITIFVFEPDLDAFLPRQDLAVTNPVDVSAVTYRQRHYLVVASQHLPESVRSSVLTIFRYKPRIDKWVRYQDLPLDAPVSVQFAMLPSDQLALYVLTANPTRALVVYLYRGIQGFVEETVGLTVHSGTRISAFQAAGRNFIGISGHGKGQIIVAEMEGHR